MNLADTIRQRAAAMPMREIPFPHADREAHEQKLLRDFDRLDGATKSAIKDMHWAMRDANASESEQATTRRVVDHKLRLEARAAGLDPRRRILRNPVFRVFFNALARKLCRAPLSGEQAAVLKGLGQDASPGSNLIRDELDDALFDLLLSYGAWATLGPRPLGSRTKKCPVLTGRPNAQFITTESAALADDANITGLSVSGDSEVIGVLINFSIQLLDDMDADLASALLDAVEQAINARLDNACFRGNGAVDGDNGGILGLFDNASGALSVTAGSGITTVEALTSDDFYNAIGAVDAASLQRGGRWWIAPALLPKLMRCREGSQPALKSVLETGGATLFSLCGFPLTLTAAAPSTNAASSKVMLFGHGPAYVVPIRKEVTFELSDHFKWNTLQRSLRAYMRATGKMRVGTGFATLSTAAA